MIKLLRNKEVRQSFLVMLIISVISSVTAFVFDMRFGIFTSVLCVLLICVFLIFSYRRYKEIINIAYDIDNLLHKNILVNFDEYSEGELGILKCEIQKMTERLREQQENLLKDKQYLSSSIADISHQIRTPLTSINLYVQFLSAPDIPEERRQVITRELYLLLSRIDWLITALLKISKLDAKMVTFKRETVNLEDFIKKAASPLLVPMEVRNQPLIIKGEGNGVFDVLWTMEAVGNILKNCMEHTPDGEEVSISATENPLYSQIVIEDNGEGISKEDMPHIFERFYKGKNSDDKNFGIGLNLARMIITEQNGIVKVENRETKGARFIIRFYKETV